MVEAYSRDPEWWHYVLSVKVFTSFAAILLCHYVLSPILVNACIPKDKLKKLGPEKALFHTYLGSTVHAVEAFFFAGYILLTGTLGKNRIFSVTSNSITAMQITLGCSLADLWILSFNSYLRNTYYFLFIHHVVMVAGVLMGLYHQLYVYFIVHRLLNELSTPFVDWRAVIREVGDKDGRWYSVAFVAMVVTFFACRIIAIPRYNYLLYSDILSAEASKVPWYLNLYMIVSYAAFDVLNIYWFFRMLSSWFRYLEKQHYGLSYLLVL